MDKCEGLQYNENKMLMNKDEEIKKTWDDDQKPTVIETPSEVDGLNDMSISFSSEEEDPSSHDIHSL